MKDFLLTAVQLIGSAFAFIGMIPIGIIYLLGYVIGMRFSGGSSANLGLFMIVAPILGVVTTVLFLIWLL